MKLFASLIQNMAASEWLPHVPGEVMDDIKAKHDAIEVYCIAHPGESESTVIHQGEKGGAKLKWFGRILETIRQSIRPKTPAFFLHNTQDNSHEGRTVLGEVINTFKDAQDRVYTIIRRFKDTLVGAYKTTVASFEAPFDPSVIDRGGEVQPGDIGPITGIALANGAIDKPAFAGANLAAALQCLKGEEVVPKEIIKQQESLTDLIERLRNHPDFATLTREEIFQDEEKPVKPERDNHFHQVERLKREKAQAIEARQALEKEYADKISARDSIILDYKTRDTLAEAMKSRTNLSDKHREYIESHRQYLKVDPAQDISQQINAFLDSQIKDAEKFIPTASAPENLPSPETQPSGGAVSFLPK